MLPSFLVGVVSYALAAEIDPVCEQFFVPFADRGRDTYRDYLKRCTGKYGDYRVTRIKGHRHAGVDLKGKAGEAVYAVGVGRVVYRYWSFPNETVVIRHRLPSGASVYSVYTHLRDIQLMPGDLVDEYRAIGRLFNLEEKNKAHFATIHLHLEIRKNVEDFGRASYSSLSREELDKYCIDPHPFFREHLK